MDADGDARAAEQALLERVAADLDAGFVDLYGAHRRLIYSIALRVTGRPSDAEDVTAETFLRAYRALRGYDRDRITALHPRSWLATIAVNVWRNARRSAARAPREVPIDVGVEAVDGAEPAAATVERAETGRELAALLARLPERQRLAVVLRHVTGLSVAEVAEALGVPENTVKSHAARGLRRLRTMYEAGDTGRERVEVGHGR